MYKAVKLDSVSLHLAWHCVPYASHYVQSSASKLAPDAYKFTRFKQDFLSDLQYMFDHLVNLTEPICQKRNPDLAGMTIFDTSGIETWVTENNPKYANRIIKQLKVFKKSHNRYD